MFLPVKTTEEIYTSNAIIDAMGDLSLTIFNQGTDDVILFTSTALNSGDPSITIPGDTNTNNWSKIPITFANNGGTKKVVVLRTVIDRERLTPELIQFFFNFPIHRTISLKPKKFITKEPPEIEI